MTTINLKPHKEESLLRFHPWVFSGAIRSIALDKDYPYAEPREGELVQVVDSQGNTLGVGHYQIGSIAVRILAFGVSELPTNFWQERIAAAYEVRQRLGLVRADNNSYRLVHGEGDFLPGLIVDIYADTAVVQAHSIGMHCHRQEIAEAIVAKVEQVDKVYYKSDDTLPHKAMVEGERVGYLIGGENADFNGDNILETYQMSGYATVAPYGKTLGDDYVASNPKYLSPDRVVDLSTALFPEYTYIIKGAYHVAGSYGTDYSEFLVWLLTYDGEFYAGANEKYPQFMVSGSEQTLSGF